MHNLDEMVKRWEPTGLLQAFSEAKVRNAAACLEAQRSLNENRPEADVQFKRLSIPLVVRALCGSTAFQENQFLPGNDSLEVHFFTSKFTPPTAGAKPEDNLQAEAEYAATFAEQLREEFDKFFDTRRGLMYFGGLEKLTDGSIVMYYALS
jgi:hypothetical protein